VECRILYLVHVFKRVDLEIPGIPVPRIRALIFIQQELHNLDVNKH
jgi:hypothetical protein